MGRPSSKASSVSSTYSASSNRSIFSTGRLTNIEEVDCEVFIKPVPPKSNSVLNLMLYMAGHEPAHSHLLMRTKIRTYRGIDSEGRINEWQEKEQDWVSDRRKSRKHHTSGKRDGKVPPIQMPRPAQNRFPRPPPPGARQPQPGRQGVPPPPSFPPPPGFPPRPAGGFHQPEVQVVDEAYTSSEDGSDWSDATEVVDTSHAQPPPNFNHRQGGPVRRFPGPPPPPPPPQAGLPGGAPFIRR